MKKIKRGLFILLILLVGCTPLKGCISTKATPAPDIIADIVKNLTEPGYRSFIQIKIDANAPDIEGVELYFYRMQIETQDDTTKFEKSTKPKLDM